MYVRYLPVHEPESSKNPAAHTEHVAAGEHVKQSESSQAAKDSNTICTVTYITLEAHTCVRIGAPNSINLRMGGGGVAGASLGFHMSGGGGEGHIYFSEMSYSLLLNMIKFCTF